MNSPPNGGDERIKELLTGNTDEVAAGFSETDKAYRYKICGLLRHRFPGLPSEDLPEIWQDTLISLYRMVRGRRFNHGGQLGGLLQTIATRRGQDRMRRNSSWQLSIDSLIHEMHEPVLLEKWQALNALERIEIVDLICEFVERLPLRQQTVWRTYITHYPDAAQLDYLTDQVCQNARLAAAEGQSEKDGPFLSKKAVASALHAGRVKIREALRTRGYEL